MIRSKQIEELKRLSTNLRDVGVAKPPSLEHHVMMALVSGEVPKIKSPKDISNTARTKIVGERYSRNLSFGDVFLSCNGYEGEMKVWNTYERNRLAAVAKYKKEADKILLRAMGDDADAADIAEQLHDAAEKSGLKLLTPPSFETED